MYIVTIVVIIYFLRMIQRNRLRQWNLGVGKEVYFLPLLCILNLAYYPVAKTETNMLQCILGPWVILTESCNSVPWMSQGKT